jgi:hypothetical protein
MGQRTCKTCGHGHDVHRKGEPEGFDPGSDGIGPMEHARPFCVTCMEAVEMVGAPVVTVGGQTFRPTPWHAWDDPVVVSVRISDAATANRVVEALCGEPFGLLQVSRQLWDVDAEPEADFIVTDLPRVWTEHGSAMLIAVADQLTVPFLRAAIDGGADRAYVVPEELPELLKEVRSAGLIRELQAVSGA